MHADDAARRRGAARRRDGRVWRLHARVRVRVIDDVDLAAWGQVRRYLSHVARPRRVTEDHNLTTQMLLV